MLKHLGLPLIVLAALSGTAMAQAWPSRQITLVLPSAAGGSGDSVARPLAEKLRVELGQPVIVDNKPGGGSVIGVTHVLGQPADGHTLLFGAVHYAIMQATFKNLPFDMGRDLVNVTGLGQLPNALIVRKDLPAQTMPEFLSWAKANSGKLNLGTGGKGTLHHLTAELFMQTVGVKGEAVHFRGSAPAIQELLGGRLDFMFETMPSASAQIRSGNVRALAVTTGSRVGAFADVPTLKESGVPGIEISTWYSVMVKTGTPQPVVDRLQQAVAKVLQDPELKATYANLGFAGGGGESAAASQAFWQSELTRWKKVVTDAGVTLD